MISYTFRNLVQQTHQIIFFYPRVLWKEDDSITILALIPRFSNTYKTSKWIFQYAWQFEV